MENYLTKENIFYIIPKDFDKTSLVKLATTDIDTLTFEDYKYNTQYNSNEEIEVFSGGKSGLLHFYSTVLKSDNGFLQIKRPCDYEILQRRENSRISIKEDVIIKDENTGFKAKLIDLSVGGMKIFSDKELTINIEYDVHLGFENLDLNFKFLPLRIEFKEDKYQISGQLNSENSSDKIELVQYCYKKQFEESNRK